MAATWQEKCRAQGQRPAVFPDGPNMGEPACQYFDRAGTPRYAAADLTLAERLGAWMTTTTETGQKAAGAVVAGRDTVVGAIGESTGLNKGLAGLTGKLLGVPHWVVLAAVGYVAYRILEKETR